MPELPPSPEENTLAAVDRRVRWDALAAIIAALIGLLALCVSGYTAYIQRQQVRAQVWPYLISGNNDLTQSLTVGNKGVGPAVVHSVQVRIDGKPQTDWNHLMAALGRMAMDICFCSTLGECWISENRNLIGSSSMPLQVKMKPVDRCPRLQPAEVFNN